MSTEYKVFTPLRMALITAIVLSNLLAVVSVVAKQQPWSEALGVFSIVFIMLFVFVILLELVWMHHSSKAVEDVGVKRKYRLAKLIYLVMFLFGFAIAYMVLMT